jgi:amylosucrase/maltose alpha-D-glucosyltransferase/alpha-amylase
VASKKPFEENDEEELEFATRRILLLHGVIFTVGGIPLIYLGDELGTLNDYSFRDDPELEGDSRWVHRARFDPQRADLRRAAQTIPARIYQGLLRLVQIRQQNLAFTRGDTEIMDPGNDQVFGFFRHHDDQSVLVLANFSEREQAVSGKRLRLLELRRTFTDIVVGAAGARQETVAPCGPRNGCRGTLARMLERSPRLRTCTSLARRGLSEPPLGPENP